jgi:hypothetical protein
LLGLLAFVLPLLRTLHFAILCAGRRLGNAEWFGCLLFLAAVVILLATEGTGTKLMVPYIMIGILPDLVRRLGIVPVPQPTLGAPEPAPRRRLGLLGRHS